MFKAFSILFILTSSSVGLGIDKSLEIPASISFITSKDGPYDSKYGNRIRHRMTVKNSLSEESSQILLFEKFAPGKQGTADKIIFSKEMSVTDLPKIKEHVTAVAKKSAEATYGCCGIEEALWTGYKVGFKVRSQEVLFHCETTEFLENDFSVSCKK